MLEKKCKKIIAIHTIAAALVLAGATGLVADTAQASARPGASAAERQAVPVVVDSSGPALIRFEWGRGAALVPDGAATSIRTLDRSPRGLLVALHEAGSYEFRFDIDSGNEAGVEEAPELLISRLDVEVSHRSFWLEMEAGRAAVEHTVYRVVGASCLKNEEDETDPDPPSPGGLTVGPGDGRGGSLSKNEEDETDPDPPSQGGLTAGPGHDLFESACLKNEEDETDPDPPSPGGLTAGPETSAVAGFIEVRSGASASAERLLAVAVVSRSLSPERALVDRLGFENDSAWTALISRPITAGAGQTWRAQVAGKGPHSLLDVAAWTAPLVWPALPDFGEQPLRLLSLVPLAE